MTRWLVVAGLFVLSLITYVDRAAISSVKDALGKDLGLSDTQTGSIFGAFALGYAVAQIPAGWLADRAGPKLLLTGAVLLWSALTAATGLAYSMFSLWIVRFLFGAAEAAAFPGAARAFFSWLPSSEHGRANGLIFAGSRLGAAGAFPLMAWLLESHGWRQCFLLLALPGILWSAGWWIWFRDRPPAPVRSDDPSPEVRPAIVPWWRLMASRPMLLAMTQYFCTNFTTFLCLSWMNPYLKERYQLSPSDAAIYTLMPLLFGAGAQGATGVLVDRLYRSRWRHRSRQIPAMAGFVISSAGLTAVPAAGTAALASIFFTLAAFGAEMTISPSWAFCLDTGGANSGTMSGAMNMFGNLGSFVSASAFPWMAALTGSYAPYFWMVAGLNLLAAACWTGMRMPRVTLRSPASASH